MDDILIGIDCGNGECKTRNTIFRSHIRKVSGNVTFADNTAKINDTTVVYGEKKSSYQKDKYKDDNLYVQIMIATAKELYARDVRGGVPVKVILCVGLPPKLFSKQSKELKEYILSKREVRVEVEGRSYSIKVSECFVTVQGLAATKIKLRNSIQQVMTMDIGYGTVDFLCFANGKVIESKCGSEILGVRSCFDEAKAEIMNSFNETLDLEAFEFFIRDKKEVISEEYCSVLEKVVRRYADKLWDVLLEHGYNPNTMALHIMGGRGTFV